MSTIVPAIAGPMDVELPVPCVQQDHDAQGQPTSWCWAACAQMVAYYPTAPLSALTQCQIADTMFPGSDCCGSSFGYCNRPMPPEFVVNLYKFLPRPRVATPIATPLSPAAVLAALKRKSPVQLCLALGQSVLHFVLIVGISNAASTYTVNDPASGTVAEKTFQDAAIQCQFAWSIA